MDDEMIIQVAKEIYESEDGNILIQDIAFNPTPDSVVDRLDDGTGAWVLAWVYVATPEGDDDE